MSSRGLERRCTWLRLWTRITVIILQKHKIQIKVISCSCIVHKSWSWKTICGTIHLPCVLGAQRVACSSKHRRTWALLCVSCKSLSIVFHSLDRISRPLSRMQASSLFLPTTRPCSSWRHTNIQAKCFALSSMQWGTKELEPRQAWEDQHIMLCLQAVLFPEGAAAFFVPYNQLSKRNRRHQAFHSQALWMDGTLGFIPHTPFAGSRAQDTYLQGDLLLQIQIKFASRHQTSCKRAHPLWNGLDFRDPS